MVDVWGREGAGGERGVGEGDVRGVSTLLVGRRGGGKMGGGGGGGRKGLGGDKEGTLLIRVRVKQAFRALQTAYIRLLQNPFYVPDEHTPMAAKEGRGKGSQITSRRFIEEVERIGMAWRPGVGIV